MNTSLFYGGHLQRASSSSDENEDEMDPSFVLSQDDIDTQHSDETNSDESDEEHEATRAAGIEASTPTANSTENNIGSNAVIQTAWRAMISSSRLFNCTATEIRHFTDELPCDREIEPID